VWRRQSSNEFRRDSNIALLTDKELEEALTLCCDKCLLFLAATATLLLGRSRAQDENHSVLAKEPAEFTLRSGELTAYLAGQWRFHPAMMLHSPSQTSMILIGEFWIPRMPDKPIHNAGGSVISRFVESICHRSVKTLTSIVLWGICLTIHLHAQEGPISSLCSRRVNADIPDADTRELLSTVHRLTRQGKTEPALDLITPAIQEHPENSRLEIALSELLYRKGKLREAVDALNRANQLDPCDAEAHYFAWRVNATAGLYGAAQKQLDIAHALAPNSALIQRMWSNTQEALPPEVIADIPPHFDFYAKHIDCEGIPVRAASVVSATTLVQVCGYVRQMLANLPNVRENLIARGGELQQTNLAIGLAQQQRAAIGRYLTRCETGLHAARKM